MNIDSYNSLPDDLKKVIDDNSGEEYAKMVGQVWRNSEEGGLKVALNDPDDPDPNEHIVLSEDEMKAFRAALEPVNQRWIDEVTAAGIDGQALYDAAKAAVAEHSDGQM